MSRLKIALASFAVSLIIVSAVASDNSAGRATDHAVLPTTSSANDVERKIKASLDVKTSVDQTDQPLSEWISYLSDKYRVQIQFDSNALRDASLDPATLKVGFTLKDISIRSALRLILKQYDLTYVINDEVLLITTTDRAKACLTICVFDVRDLVSDANADPIPAQLIDSRRLLSIQLAHPRGTP